MNAKFFDLKQEKQDRIINAALKIFALNGYGHASTDDIVREAHISKGLLFHYFDSKIGVYSFIHDYAVKLISLELSSAIDPDETSYFALLKQIEAAKMQVLKSHPYMCVFLKSCEKETVTEALLSIEESRKTYRDNLGTILARADQAFMNQSANASKLLKMLDYTLEGIMETALFEGSFTAEDNFNEAVKYISLTEQHVNM